jgi:hypothetical protein
MRRAQGNDFVYHTLVGTVYSDFVPEQYRPRSPVFSAYYHAERRSVRDDPPLLAPVPRHVSQQVTASVLNAMEVNQRSGPTKSTSPLAVQSAVVKHESTPGMLRQGIETPYSPPGLRHGIETPHSPPPLWSYGNGMLHPPAPLLRHGIETPHSYPPLHSYGNGMLYSHPSLLRHRIETPYSPPPSPRYVPPEPSWEPTLPNDDSLPSHPQNATPVDTAHPLSPRRDMPRNLPPPLPQHQLQAMISTGVAAQRFSESPRYVPAALSPPPPPFLAPTMLITAVSSFLNGPSAQSGTSHAHPPAFGHPHIPPPATQSHPPFYGPYPPAASSTQPTGLPFTPSNSEREHYYGSPDRVGGIAESLERDEVVQEDGERTPPAAQAWVDEDEKVHLRICW